MAGGGTDTHFQQRRAAKAVQSSTVPHAPQCNGAGSAAHLRRSRRVCRGLCCWSCFCRRRWDAQLWIRRPEQVPWPGTGRTLALRWAPELHEGCPAWAAWKNYSGSLLLALLPQWGVRCQGCRVPSIWTPLRCFGTALSIACKPLSLAFLF